MDGAPNEAATEQDGAREIDGPGEFEEKRGEADREQSESVAEGLDGGADGRLATGESPQLPVGTAGRPRCPSPSLSPVGMGHRGLGATVNIESRSV